MKLLRVLLGLLLLFTLILVSSCEVFEDFIDTNTSTPTNPPAISTNPITDGPMTIGPIPTGTTTTNSEDLSWDDQDLYQQVVQILGSDPEYNRLDYTMEQFKYLVTEADCLSLALRIRTPAVSSDGTLLNLGRPQLQAVVQIKDIEGYRGNLMEELTAKAELSQKLNNVAEYIKDFFEAYSEKSYWGIFKTFAKIGANSIMNSLLKELNNYAFNHLYQGYKEGRDATQGNSHGSGMEAITEVSGPYFNDLKTVTLFYMDLNDKAKVGWDSELINQMVGQYLDQRYRTEKGMSIDPWLVPVTKPQHAMENALRHDAHILKMHLKQVFKDFTKPCADNAPRTSITPTQSELKTQIIYFEGTQNIRHKYTYYIKNGEEYFHGVWVTYRENGVMEYQTNWKDGVHDGLQQHYNPDGKLDWEYMTQNGLRDGPYKLYYDNGKLFQEQNWENDKKNGLDRVYYLNGQIWEEVTWKDDQKIPGTYKCYDEKGNLIKSG
jgi:antitoxin component YwqK of YwqJK toxin-antitoxin module